MYSFFPPNILAGSIQTNLDNKEVLKGCYGTYMLIGKMALKSDIPNANNIIIIP